MNINLTLIGQAISFALFVWFCMRFVWPPLKQMMDERTARIEEGLSASDNAKVELEKAQQQAEEIRSKARSDAGEIVGKAERRANETVENAKVKAGEEAEKILANAREEIALERNRAREALRGEVAALIVAGSGKVLGKELDAKAHQDALQRIASEL